MGNEKPRSKLLFNKNDGLKTNIKVLAASL